MVVSADNREPVQLSAVGNGSENSTSTGSSTPTPSCARPWCLCQIRVSGGTDRMASRAGCPTTTMRSPDIPRSTRYVRARSSGTASFEGSTRIDPLANQKRSMPFHESSRPMLGTFGATPRRKYPVRSRSGLSYPQITISAAVGLSCRVPPNRAAAWSETSSRT